MRTFIPLTFLFVASNPVSSANTNIARSQFLDLGIGPKFKGGFTYIEKSELHARTNLTLNGETFETKTYMNFTSEMTVTNLAAGGQQVDASVTKVQLEIVNPFSNVTCDSEDKTLNSDDATCKLIDPLAGPHETFVIDDQGNIAEHSRERTEGSDDSLAALMLFQQLQQASNVAKFLPTYPVKRYEFWDIENATLVGDGSGPGTAKGVFTGNTDFDGNSCAVIHVDGKFEVPLQQLLNKIPASPEVKGLLDDTGTSIGSVGFKMIIYYDISNQQIRWFQAEESFKMKVKDPVDGKLMNIPVILVLASTTDIKQ